MKKIMACALAVLMIFGTCATASAGLFSDADKAYVNEIIDNAKAEIDNIIDVAKNGTNDEKLAVIDAYVETVKDVLVEAGVAEGAKLDAIEARIRLEIDNIVKIAVNGGLDVPEADEELPVPPAEDGGDEVVPVSPEAPIYEFVVGRTELGYGNIARDQEMYDATEGFTSGKFPLTVMLDNTTGALGGTFVLTYDPAKVTLKAYKNRNWVNASGADKIWNTSEYSAYAEISTPAQGFGTDGDRGYVYVSWVATSGKIDAEAVQAGTAYDTEEEDVPPLNAEIGCIVFETKEGVTAADFDKNTFKLYDGLTNATITAGLASGGSPLSFNVKTDAGDRYFGVSDSQRTREPMNVKFKYPNSDVDLDAGESYTVTFVADGNTVRTITKNVGETLTVAEFPKVPAKKGYTGIWDTDADITEAATVTAVYTKNSLVDAYVEYLKSLFDFTEEEKDVIDKVGDEIKDIIDIVEGNDKEAAKEKINAYVDFLLDTMGVSAEDKAKVAEIVANITAIIDEAKDLTKEDLKALIDLEIAKNGHKHYDANQETSYYVAIGGDTVSGTGIDREAKAYYDLVSEYYAIDKKAVSHAKLLPSGTVDMIVANSAEIAKADLITYQMDASSILYATLYDVPNWGKYFDADAQAIIAEVWAQAKVVYAANWKTEGGAIAEDAAAKIKAAVLAKLPEQITDGEEYVDAVIDFCMPYVNKVLGHTQYRKGQIADAVENAVASIDETIIGYAEKLAYAVVSFAAENYAAIEAIQAINPDATLLVAGLYNPAQSLVINTAEGAINADAYVGTAIDVANLYFATLAAADGGFAYVDVSDAETNGFATAIDTTALNYDEILSVLLNAEDSMHANVAGHAYISEQIINALTCVPGLYEAIDEETHAIKCILCEAVLGTEAHTFVDDTCEYCGYTKEVEPEEPVRGGGGGSSNQFVIKFETNGGSAVKNVTVKKGAVLVAPADPTKAGYAFAGWYTDKALTNKYDFATPVTKAFTLYAKWVEAYTVFTDLDQNAWYFDYVKAAIEAGLMNGISATEFAPDATLTRGMFVTILHRVEKAPVAEGEIAFTDVAEDAYYADAVKWAAANGIVLGVSETEFAPDANVTREQMAAMIARYAEYKKLEVAEEGEVTYTDADQIAEYAQEAVVVTNKLVLLIGNDDGSFAPKNNATRAQAATLFVRLLNVLAK